MTRCTWPVLSVSVEVDHLLQNVLYEDSVICAPAQVIAMKVKWCFQSMIYYGAAAVSQHNFVVMFYIFLVSVHL